MSPIIPSSIPLPRRAFLKRVLAGTSAAFSHKFLLDAQNLPHQPGPAKLPYRGPKVILVRFGGGARRRETIEAQATYAPFLCHEFAKRGTLFTRMEIDSFTPTVGVDTSHGQGTLYLITGKYEKYKDITNKILAERFAPKVPTVFEYLRKAYGVPDYQTLIVNGEDRSNEEFYTFSNHHLYGINYRSNTLSLYRYKTYLLRRSIAEGKWTGKELARKQKELAKLEAVDYRNAEPNGQGPELVRFWERWRAYYGDSGLVNPRIEPEICFRLSAAGRRHSARTTPVCRREPSATGGAFWRIRRRPFSRAALSRRCALIFASPFRRPSAGPSSMSRETGR